MDLLVIISSIIFIVCIILIFILSQYNKIKETMYKINISSNEIKDNLDKKIDVLDRLINIIERELKIDNKTFKKFKSIKSKKLTEIELDALLQNTSSLVITIKEDNSKLSKVKSFDGLILELNELDSKLVALRTYYNKYSGKFNNIIKKPTYKLLVLIKKYKSYKFYEGNQIEEEVIF